MLRARIHPKCDAVPGQQAPRKATPLAGGVFLRLEEGEIRRRAAIASVLCLFVFAACSVKESTNRFATIDEGIFAGAGCFNSGRHGASFSPSPCSQPQADRIESAGSVIFPGDPSEQIRGRRNLPMTQESPDIRVFRKKYGPPPPAYGETLELDVRIKGVRYSCPTPRKQCGFGFQGKFAWALAVEEIIPLAK